MDLCITYAVGQEDQNFLATRSKARQIRNELEDRIASDTTAELVVIDFSDVEAMTISFADEFLGRFYTALAAGDVRPIAVLLTGLNDDTAETVSICLERRELFAASLNGTQATLLGAQDFFAESYRRALKLERFKASDLAESLGITPQNANNRLRRLVEVGALRKERVTAAGRGGKEFSYSLPLREQSLQCGSA
jgi:anti-anti-sigma regulatory factor